MGINKKELEMIKNKSISEFYVPFQTFFYSREYVYFGGVRANALSVFKLWKRDDVSYAGIIDYVHECMLLRDKVSDLIDSKHVKSRDAKIYRETLWVYWRNREYLNQKPIPIFNHSELDADKIIK